MPNLGSMCIDRGQFPPKKMTAGLFPGWRRIPSYSPTYFKFDLMISPLLLVCQLQNKLLPHAGDALTRWCVDKVIVSVPPRLNRQIGNEFKNLCSRIVNRVTSLYNVFFS